MAMLNNQRVTIKRRLLLMFTHFFPTFPSLAASTAEKPPHSDDSNVDPLQDQSWKTRRKPYPLVGKLANWRNCCKCACQELPGNHLQWRVQPPIFDMTLKNNSVAFCAMFDGIKYPFWILLDSIEYTPILRNVIVGQILMSDTNHVKSTYIVLVGSPSPANQPSITSPFTY